MQTILKMAILLALFFAAAPRAEAQIPSIQDLTRNVNEAAGQVSDKTDSILGFKKLEMPKPLAGLLDVRFKKPTLPNFGFLDKLKNIGTPQFGTNGAETPGPIMAGLGKLFPPRDKTQPSFLDRMLGRTESGSQSNSLFNSNDMAELNQVTDGLQDHIGRMSSSTTSDLFGGQNESPQPPLSAARQFTGQTQSRY
ncbi:hypothetical protein [Mariniblastus fucicola]|uniref:Uncharacterized protein n=1 Tax=Mariniblastus fucicola TaxID=980251 RepID=A0A5B9PDS6_9BACT|nr:hypothetical protein [Mariniblastus fucicola]QEG22726.1 hypothetical protein MFFC18_26090 [Mariniblastus fucicola]